MADTGDILRSTRNCTDTERANCINGFLWIPTRVANIEKSLKNENDVVVQRFFTQSLHAAGEENIIRIVWRFILYGTLLGYQEYRKLIPLCHGSYARFVAENAADIENLGSQTTDCFWHR